MTALDVLVPGAPADTTDHHARVEAALQSAARGDDARAAGHDQILSGPDYGVCVAAERKAGKLYLDAG